MSLKNKILESPLGYGCGPGPNSPFFGPVHDSLGVDINPAYIETAKRKYPTMKFAVGDATRLDVSGRFFDIVLINSLLHHLDDDGTLTLLTAIKQLLRPDGVIAVQEPLIPHSNEWFIRLMMKMDRGKHFRTLDRWRHLYSESGYEAASEEFYQIKILGITGWRMHSVLLRPIR